MAEELRLSLLLTADADGFVGEMKISREELERLKRQSTETARAAATTGGSMDRLGRDSRRAADSTRTLHDRQRQLVGGFGAVRAAIAALGVTALVREYVRLADTAAQLEGRLRLVTSSQEELRATQAALFQVAQDTRSSFQSTVELYARVARSTADLNISQSDLLAITKTVNQAIQVSGASAAEASAGVIQFTQAIAGGVLRAEEFNSIIEQTPRLAEAIATGLGISLGEMRRQVEAGTLTATRLLTALQSQGGAVGQEFARLPRTVSSALTQLRNDMLSAVGAIDDGSGATQTLTGHIDALRLVIVAPEFQSGLTFIVDVAGKISTEFANAVREIGAFAELARNFSLGGLGEFLKNNTVTGLVSRTYQSAQELFGPTRFSVEQNAPPGIGLPHGLPEFDGTSGKPKPRGTSSTLTKAQQSVLANFAEQRRELKEQIAAQQALTQAYDQGAVAVAEMSARQAVLSEVQRISSKFTGQQRAELAGLIETLNSGERALAVREALFGLDEDLTAQKALTAATREGAAAVRAAEAANQARATAVQLGIAGDAAAVAAIESKIRALQDEATAQENVRKVRGLEDELRLAEEELRLIGATAEQRTVALALLEKELELKQRGIDLTSEQARAELKLTEQVARTRGKVEEVTRQRDLLLEPLRNAIQGIQEAFSSAFKSIFSGGVSSFKDLGREILSIFTSLAAQIAALLVFKPVVGGVLNAAGLGGIAQQLGFGGGAGGGGGSAFDLGSLLSGGSFFNGSAGVGNGFVDVAKFFGAGPSTQAAFGNAGLNLSSPAGIAGGFAGNLGANLLFGNRGIGADIGGALGAAAGSFIPIPFVGTALGGFLGNLLGGLFKGSASGSMGLETLPTPTSPDVNPFAGRGVSAHRRSPFGVVGFQSGADQLKGQADEVVDAAGAMDKAIARILSDGQIAQVSTYLQANPPPISTASSFKEADFRGQILGRGLDILEGLGAGPLRDFEALGLSAKDEGSVGKLGDLVQQLVDTLNFLEGATDEYTEAARQQVGAVVEQADAIRESVATFNLAAGQAAQAEARIREEALKLLAPPEEELSATEQALKQLDATFAELRENAGKLGLTLADIDPAQNRALADLAAGFDDTNRRAILSITDPLSLALEDFDKVAAQRLEDVAALGADTVLVERRHMLERAKIVEQFAEQSTNALRQWLDGQLLGPTSALAPQDRLAEAQRQFDAAIADGRAGDTSQVTGAADTLLQESQRYHGNAPQAFELIETVRGQVAALLPGGEQDHMAAVAQSGRETVIELKTHTQHLQAAVRVLQAGQSKLVEQGEEQASIARERLSTERRKAAVAQR